MEEATQLVLAVGRIVTGSVQLLGTAFSVGGSKVATALHVVGSDDRDLVVVRPRTQSLSEYQDTTDNSITWSPVKMTSADPLRDLCILEMQSAHTDYSYPLGSTDQTLVGAAITTLGFPHAPMGRLVLTQQDAQVGARVLIGSSGQKSKHIIINTQAREGQSGGPVLDSVTKEVIAVILGSYAPNGGGQISLGGVDPATLHQTTHAISAEYLKAML